MRKIALLTLMILLAACVVGCANTPLVATATPAPTHTPAPTATPAPTPGMILLEETGWPDRAIAQLLPEFSDATIEECMVREDDSYLFIAFTLLDADAIQSYCTQLQEAGFDTIIESSPALFKASDSSGDLMVQLWYDAGMGTLQLTDNRK